MAARRVKRKGEREAVAGVDGGNEPALQPADSVAKPRLEGPERALKAATVFLSSVDDFRFCAAVYDNTLRRKYWIGRLEENLAARQTQLTVLDFTSLQDVRLLHGLQDHLQRVATPKGWRRAVAVIGLEQHLPDPLGPTGPTRRTNPFLADANLDRELFPRDCPVPILVWLTPTGIGSFARDAPDLWHWRSHVFYFEEPIAAEGSSPSLALTEMESAGAGTVYRNREELERAAAVFREGLKAGTLAHGPSHPSARQSRANLGNVMRQLGHYRQAEALCRENLSVVEKQTEADPAELASALNNLGACLQEIGKFEEAETLIRRALKINEKRFGKDYFENAANLNNLALGLVEKGEFVEAERLMQRALEITEKTFGRDHANVGIRLHNLARVLFNTNRLGEAEALMRRALEIAEKSLGADHPHVAAYQNNLAQALQAAGRTTEAEPLMRRALEIDEKSLGKNHPTLAIRLNNLAQLMKDTNRLKEAETLMREALEILLNSSFQTGHESRNLEIARGNYIALRKEMGVSDEQVEAEVTQIAQHAKGR